MKLTKRQLEATRKAEAKYNHLQNLFAIGYKPATLKPLKALELKANKMATDECNGEKEYSSQEWQDINARVKELFSQDIAEYNFFINTDPRGYALKLDLAKNVKKIEIYKDWGGYGILCPEFN